MKFMNIPDGASIKIYTLATEFVRELDDPVNNKLFWDGRNQQGQLVSSGLYFYILYNPRGIKNHFIGKIAVIR